VANGGTGTATPSIVAGTNVTVTGTWPNQTINSSGGGGSSQWTTSGSNIYYNTGSVLIGSSTAPTGFSRLSLVGGTGPNSGIQMTYDASTFGGGSITTVNAAGGGMAFYTFTGNVGSETYSERMRLVASGNMGIGETSPTTRLVVKGDGAPLTVNSANSNGGKIALQNNGTVVGYLGTTTFGGVIDCAFQASDVSGNIRFAVASASGTIGLNTQPATSGTGITFPATQSASSDANTLDDYEEGTWTPALSGLSSSYAYRLGSYTKIGNFVTAFFDFNVSSLGSGSWTGLITGLPFTVSSSMGGYSVINWRSSDLFTTSTVGGQLKGFVDQGTTTIAVQIDNSGIAGFGSAGGAIAINSSGRATGYVTYQSS
jgi:hypothetical protein